MKTPSSKPSLEQAIMNDGLEAWRTQRRRAHAAKAARSRRHPIAERLSKLLADILIIAAIILFIFELFTR